MQTYNGHVKTQIDAILLFEACRQGLLPRLQRRLSERERMKIKSGCVYVWDEEEAGMKRWTDGRSWSASRVSGAFLTYREMENRPSNISYTDGRESSLGSDDGYRYKPNGLYKQSFSITTSTGLKLHLINYYTKEQIKSGELMQPMQDPSLMDIDIPIELYPENSSGVAVIPATTSKPLKSVHELAIAQSQASHVSQVDSGKPVHGNTATVISSPIGSSPIQQEQSAETLTAQQQRESCTYQYRQAYSGNEVPKRMKMDIDGSILTAVDLLTSHSESSNRAQEDNMSTSYSFCSVMENTFVNILAHGSNVVGGAQDKDVSGGGPAAGVNNQLRSMFPLTRLSILATTSEERNIPPNSEEGKDASFPRNLDQSRCCPTDGVVQEELGQKVEGTAHTTDNQDNINRRGECRYNNKRRRFSEEDKRALSVLDRALII